CALQGSLTAATAQATEDEDRSEDEQGDQQQASDELGCGSTQAHAGQQRCQAQASGDAGNRAEPARCTAACAGCSGTSGARTSGRRVGRGLLRLRRTSRRRYSLALLGDVGRLASKV